MGQSIVRDKHYNHTPKHLQTGVMQIYRQVLCRFTCGIIAMENIACSSDLLIPVNYDILSFVAEFKEI